MDKTTLQSSYIVVNSVLRKTTISFSARAFKYVFDYTGLRNWGRQNFYKGFGLVNAKILIVPSSVGCVDLFEFRSQRGGRMQFADTLARVVCIRL